MEVGGEGEELGCCQEIFQEWNHITTVLQLQSELTLFCGGNWWTTLTKVDKAVGTNIGEDRK